MKILHITAHMGAGVGKAISGLAISDVENEHRIILLEEPEKTDHIERCRENGIVIMICPCDTQIKTELIDADVTIVSWWHHPLIYKLLLMLDEVLSRAVLWSHVNGLGYPRLEPGFAGCFDACMFTSKVTLHHSDWSDADKARIGSKSELVYGMGNFEPMKMKAKKSYACNREIRIGYAGSLDYAKLHPDFTSWLKKAINSNDHIRFEIAGDIVSPLIEDVKKAGLYEKITLLGFREDIPQLLEAWDLFVYPLNPFNFATTENALLEAMAAGLPIIASDGIVENSIIQNGVNGFLVSDSFSFTAKLNELILDEDIRRDIGQRARKDVIKTYDIKENLFRFHHALDCVMKSNKKRHCFKAVMGEDAFHWFLLGCGKQESALFEKVSKGNVPNGFQKKGWKETAKGILEVKEIFKGNSKGSVKQFSKYYPMDKRLDCLSRIIDIVQEKDI